MRGGPSPGEVEVWRSSLDLSDAELHGCQKLLNPEENARASRFHFTADLQRFVAGRGILRLLLGRYLGVPAAGIVLRFATSGKPSVEEPVTDLQFNISHSGNRGLFAFARERAVGVDIEEGARLGEDLDALARRVFSARERVRWLLRPASERRAAFLDGWTRKEALLKAKGRGITDGLQAIEAPIGTGAAPMIVDKAWTVWDLRDFAGCAAALALEGTAPASVQTHDVSSLDLAFPPVPGVVSHEFVP